VAIELIVPKVGESITEVMIANWLLKENESVNRDANLVVLESDKATVELPAPTSGRLIRILKNKGEIAKVGEVIGLFEEGAGVTQVAAKTIAAASTQPPSKPASPQPTTAFVMPAAQRILDETQVSIQSVTPTGPGGRILKEDVQRAVAKEPTPVSTQPVQAPPEVRPATEPGARGTETVPMSMLRRKVAERLVQAQQNAALLTTFNEIDMSEVMALRARHQETFTQKHGVKLGFMSFFVRAVVDALRLVPQLNAQVRGNDILYHHYCDIGVAVGGGKGLVVPVIRNAESLSFAALEKTISDLGKRAQANAIALEELQGGTFTISNGGVYGSLLSTPIVNPPQSGILGMHAIQDRPIAVKGQVVIRPMMYVALTYDHRLVDGREAVTFLKRVKDAIEEPTRMLLEV
jgi:2-oxoglutarate dehydrogenase E2 component (dihydrolipoamide succinyltransferase)